MKNIEKYPNTRDAMEAFREWYKDHKHSVLTMSEWLEKDYDHHPQTTLLESAESVIKEWRRSNVEFCSFERFIDRLSHAVECEKRRPIRNFDKYKTAEDAFYGFKEMCFPNGVNECKDCRFNNIKDFGICGFAYLYAEAEKAR